MLPVSRKFIWVCGRGRSFYLKDLLYGLMLESYNDCAVAIAEHIAGTTGAFAKLMNDKAEEIGCEDSYFITPNGLDAEDAGGVHHTTARDLAQLMRYCVTQSEQKEAFQQSARQGSIHSQVVMVHAVYSI